MKTLRDLNLVKDEGLYDITKLVLNMRKELKLHIDEIIDREEYASEMVDLKCLRSYYELDTKKFGIFKLDKYKDKELIKDKRFGFNNVGNRFLITVYDVDKLPMGFVSWYPQPANAKYIATTTLGYKMGSNNVYGMEDIYNYYKSDRPVIFVEGMFCRMVLKSLGFNVLGLFGTGISKYQEIIIRRFKRRAIVIPDSDEAGIALAKKIKKHFEAKVILPILEKDIDDTRKVLGGDTLKEYLLNIIEGKERSNKGFAIYNLL